MLQQAKVHSRGLLENPKQLQVDWESKDLNSTSLAIEPGG